MICTVADLVHEILDLMRIHLCPFGDVLDPVGMLAGLDKSLHIGRHPVDEGRYLPEGGHFRSTQLGIFISEDILHSLHILNKDILISYGGRKQAIEPDPAKDQSCCVYECLNDSNAKALMMQYNRGNSDKDSCSVVLYYDEAKKKARYNKWYEFVSKITSELEIFNARTKLLDPEDFDITPKKKEE